MTKEKDEMMYLVSAGLFSTLIVTHFISGKQYPFWVEIALLAVIVGLNIELYFLNKEKSK